MCGIFGILNDTNICEKVIKSFETGKARGPENSKIEKYGNSIIGFHRLAINGIDKISNQPFIHDDIIVTCNGEIYNYKELAKNNNISLKTNSDCEIIPHLYKKFGIEYTLNILDGVFAFSIYCPSSGELILARDPYGVRPLFYSRDNNKFLYASEIKSIYPLCNDKKNIIEFTPGTFMNVDKNLIYNVGRYTNYPCRNVIYLNESRVLTFEIFNMINDAVRKRVEGTCERPIACLLSGGLDSSLICAMVKQYYRNSEHKLETYSIGLPGSEDLKYARLVAKHLDTDHHEIIVSEEDFFNAIPEVIQAIESYDTTTVRASVGNYLIAKWIRQNSTAKVVFNGDGADELMGGYLYFHKAPTSTEFDRECKRLMSDISKYDVLRSDRSISANGLEARTPFLDRKWVEFYLSISSDTRFHKINNQCEKYLIRKAFQDFQPNILPESVLWRTKEAFSDGVSSMERSWFQIIQENIEHIIEGDDKLNISLHDLINNKYLHNKPTTLEQAYYRYLYNRDYKGCEMTIPYFWMPRFIEANDASARTLNIYNERVKKGEILPLKTL
tara:strand:- start:6596 stop:8266 length:1671 start_codon:yes stop_codon:yes gene_type:complete